MPSRLPAASSQHAKQDLRPDGPAAFEQAPVPPVFRPRFRADTKPAHAAAASAAAPAAVIPLMRAPDDPGVDDGDETTEATFDREPRPLAGQEGGWRGFLARWVG
jgi:HemY protein